MVSPLPRFLLCALAGIAFANSPCALGQDALKADLDPLINLPEAYDLTPKDLEKMFPAGDWSRNPYFKWLTEDKSRAIFQRKAMRNLRVDLTLLDGTVPIEEAIVDFKDGKFLGTTISIYNWGDYNREKPSSRLYEEIPDEDFHARFRSIGKHLGEELATRPSRRTARPNQGILTSGFIWISARGKAVLEHNPFDDGQKKMFLRMRLARRDAGGAYEAATQDRPGASVRLSDLPRNVKRNKEGDVFVDNIPMVDQGAKGYCVVASAQRLFEYYGIACDMHQLGMIAGSDPERGTSTLEVNRELGAIDHLFKTRFECLAIRYRSGLVELEDGKYIGERIPNDDFHRIIKRHVDAGIPLLWGLQLGRYPEFPPISQQTSGGHMRMIIGYNDKEGSIIFSDSWGAGHEFKKMDASHALNATQGLFLLKPIVR